MRPEQSWNGAAAMHESIIKFLQDYAASCDAEGLHTEADKLTEAATALTAAEALAAQAPSLSDERIREIASMAGSDWVDGGGTVPECCERAIRSALTAMSEGK